MPSFERDDPSPWPTIDVLDELAPHAPVFETPMRPITFVRAGQALDASGSPLGGAIVDLFRSGDNSWVARQTADGSGNFSFTLGDNAGTYFVVVRNGAGTVQGVSQATLVATEG